MVTPAMVGIITFVIYPIIYLVYLSFFKYNLLNKAKSKFVGLDNYAQIFARPDFYKSILNTCLYTAGVVVLTVVISLVLAVWLSGTSKVNQFVQAGLFTPHIVSIVSIAMVWLWMMNPDVGYLNYLLKAIGLPPSQWVQSSKTALFSIILVSVWHAVGYYTLILVAAIRGIPRDIYESAMIDNASKFRMLFNITIPLISPQLFFILIIMTIGSFKVFDTVQIMTGGGPNKATNTLVYFIYEYRSTNMGYASATGVILMAAIAILTVVYFRVLSKKVHYS
ncbi:carbohydrate ABC transporter permease [Paenibacillus cremeus]|uniref:Sugar ABC transporter permease n=1 Tax=Paenibacillus cremeus TaxID=2163881 RepID=A0A559KGI0_9BACL|nr:sugar ABC transporter permease [Paenibacillus cremeus]TVY11232.1 sugar ABC transporter permease [Paenibacillus cremeus]